MSHRRALALAWSPACLLFVLASSGLAAQSIPNAITGLEITPDGGGLVQILKGNSLALEFMAHNGLITPGTWTFTCSKTGGVTCGAVVPSSATIPSGGNREIDVTFTATAAGSAKITLSAIGGETGFVNINVQALGPPTAVVTRNQNGDNIDRSACLTSDAGEAAAWSCGDLVVTHAMPTVTTMNKGRNLTLLYNSAQAAPTPLVAVAVSQSTGISLPNSVYAELKVNGVVRATGTYSAWLSAPLTRQLALSYDASADSSGIYPFTLEVQNRYTTGGNFGTTVSGNLIVVNRFMSRYGRGWSLAGIEELRLAQPAGAILWVGGDGSAKVYAPVNATTWAAAPGGYRDTLTLSASVYTRTLRHGVQVKYDAQGRHTQTISRTGQTTTFSYDGSGRLSTIAVPPGGAASTYTLTYDGVGHLDRITDPGTRVLNAAVSASNGVLSSLLDPDGVSVTFDYTGARMIGRTGRRGFRTEFAYGHGLRVTRVAVPIDAASHDTAVTTMQPWDERGLPGTTVPDTALAFTTIDGPRVGIADSARIWVDRWGAPTRLIDPIGATTFITRGDAAVPLLATRVTIRHRRVGLRAGS